MARRRRGRCHRQRRLRRWRFADLLRVPMSAFKGWQRFMFKDLHTLFQKDYEKDEWKKKEDVQVKLKDERFAGYKSICLFGLGSLFWGSATGVLGQLEKKNEEEKDQETSALVNFCFIYSACALVFMLLGVVASTFYRSSWLAPSLAGFGSLQAIILVLGGFHVASLKYHPYLNECKNSMIGSSIAITFYWGISIQDPMVLHVLIKFLLWLVSIFVYGVFMSAWLIIRGVFMGGWLILYGVFMVACKFGKYAWTRAYIKMKSQKNGANNREDDYVNLPQIVVAPVL